MEIYRKTWAEINQNHLRYNIELLQKYFSSETFLCPMVKANAYGHGDVKLAMLYQDWGLKNIGVCLIEEGLLLRQLGVKIPILVFRGFDHKGAVTMLQSQMTPVVSSWEQFEILANLKEPTPVHLKFDTGMSRLGFRAEDSEKLVARLKENAHLKLEGVLTHLYQSEDGMDPQGQTTNQLRQFDRIADFFQDICPLFHALNSGGIISKIEMMPLRSKNEILFKRDWGLRPGLLLYGYNPVEESILDFKPAMTLKSYTGVVRTLKAGEGVSYNHTWKAERDSKVAVVPIGYADGWHRILSNKASVLWNGDKASLIGNVCMDYVMVDVTDLPVEKENEVVFFGQSRTGAIIPASEVARAAGTITWEILTSVGERVPRVYV